MPTVTNLSNIGTLISGNLQEKFARSVKFCSNIYSELFNTEDLKYEKYFKSKFIASLYETHEAEQVSNCAFCSRLVSSSCHKHCLKCSMGTYIHCSPVLPGIFCYESESGHTVETPVPWIYKEPCKHFQRLEQKKYHKNLYSRASWIRLYNYEALEGISNGIAGGVKPCHLCASVDYNIFKNCLQCGKTSESNPCYNAAGLIGARILGC